jgi:hypothetical protein
MKLSINDLKLPSGDKFGLWNAYEFPDDLRTYMENEKMQRILFAKRIESSLSFLLLPKFPEFVNQEVLVNAFNNIYIDTKETGDEEITQRYFIYNN